MLSSGRFFNLSCCCSGRQNTVLSYLAPNRTHGMKPLPRHQDSRTLLQRPQRQVKRTNDTAAYPDAYLALLRDCHELADVVLLGRLLQVPALVGTTSLGEPSATPTVESSRSGGPGGRRGGRLGKRVRCALYLGLRKRNRQHAIAFSSTCGLVAMTSASHAEGRQFDPGQV